MIYQWSGTQAAPPEETQIWAVSGQLFLLFVCGDAGPLKGSGWIPSIRCLYLCGYQFSLSVLTLLWWMFSYSCLHVLWEILRCEACKPRDVSGNANALTLLTGRGLIGCVHIPGSQRQLCFSCGVGGGLLLPGPQSYWIRAPPLWRHLPLITSQGPYFQMKFYYGLGLERSSIHCVGCSLCPNSPALPLWCADSRRRRAGDGCGYIPVQTAYSTGSRLVGPGAVVCPPLVYAILEIKHELIDGVALKTEEVVTSAKAA